MKKNFFTTGVTLFAAVLICSSCNQRPKVQENKGTNSKGQTSSVEVEVFDAIKLKDQIVEIIKSSPKPGELADFFNEVGISYMAELTVPTENVEKYITLVDQSLATGMYKFDMFYAKAYNRQDVVSQLFSVQEKLIGKIGLEGETVAMKKYDDRIKQNEGNSDSLNVIVSAVMNEVYQNYATGEHSGIYALSYVSANIEGLYILTQTALMAQNKSKLFNLIGQQKERVKSNYMLLELMALDVNVAPIFEKMKPIMVYFSDDQEFTEKKLAEVAPLIKQMRDSLMK